MVILPLVTSTTVTFLGAVGAAFFCLVQFRASIRTLGIIRYTISRVARNVISNTNRENVLTYVSGTIIQGNEIVLIFFGPFFNSLYMVITQQPNLLLTL